MGMKDPQVKLLMTMPGIGYFAASMLVAEIGDINRFSNDKKISSWAAPTPMYSLGRLERMLSTGLLSTGCSLPKL
jgi:hypothetical protein